MNKKITLWIIIGVLLIIALLTTFKAGTVSAETVVPAKLATKTAISSSSYGGMVGGC